MILLDLRTVTVAGRVGIVDNDNVEHSNLQRQILHSEETVGQPKVNSAAQALRRCGPCLAPHTYSFNLNTIR